MNRGWWKVFINRWKENIGTLQFIVTVSTLFIVSGLGALEIIALSITGMVISVGYTYWDVKRLMPKEWESSATINPVLNEMLRNSRETLEITRRMENNDKNMQIA